MKCKICNIDLVWGKNHGGQEENICDACKNERDRDANEKARRLQFGKRPGMVQGDWCAAGADLPLFKDGTK